MQKFPGCKRIAQSGRQLSLQGCCMKMKMRDDQEMLNGDGCLLQIAGMSELASREKAILHGLDDHNPLLEGVASANESFHTKNLLLDDVEG